MVHGFGRHVKQRLREYVEIVFSMGLGFKDGATVVLTRAGRSLLKFFFEDEMGLGGWHDVKCFDADGNRKWLDLAKNSLTNAGLNHILNAVFNSATQITTWYMGLVDNAGWTAFSAADTSASHAGWTESQAYAAANRQTWGTTTTSSQSITNGSAVSFVMNAVKTLKGIFIISDNTKGGSSGTLMSTAAFSAGLQTVASGDTIQSTYTLSAATT